MKFVLHEREDGEWDYRMVGSNGEILNVSEGYSTKGNAQRAVDNLIIELSGMIKSDNPIIIEEQSRK